MTSCLLSPPEEEAEAANLVLHRRQARRQLEGFTTYTYPRYCVEPAHSLLASHLDRVVSGELTRLMIFAPPQHGKSELASVRFPAYWLGRRPDDPVMMSSYAASLAEGKSRQAREIVESDDYHALFPGIRTRRDCRAVDEWRLDGYRGYVKAVGVGGPITGHGGLLGIIDDPFENWAQAQSKLMRDKVWDWYRTTFRTRLWEHGAIILIQTRWHKDDLAGRILEDQGSEWTVLRLPAVAETQEERDSASVQFKQPVGQADPLGRQPGEPLCPARFSKAALTLLRRDVGPMAWPAQYQGIPNEPEGTIFRKAWFKYALENRGVYTLGDGPERRQISRDRLRFFITVDLAVSTKTTADYTVMCVWGDDGRGNIILVDVFRDRIEGPDIVPVMREMSNKWGAKYVAVESAGFQLTTIQQARREGMAVRELEADTDKIVRSLVAQVRVEGGQIWFLANTHWLDAFEQELLTFPVGSNDDQVDCLSYAAIQMQDLYVQRKAGKPGLGAAGAPSASMWS